MKQEQGPRVSTVVRTLFALLAMTLVVSGAWALLSQQQAEPDPVGGPTVLAGASDFRRASVPEGATLSDILQAHHAILDGDPLPAGFVLSDDALPAVRVTLTGVVRPSGERQAVITVEEDDQSQLEIVEVWIDGVLKKTGSVTNGMVEHFPDGTALGTVTLMLPADPAILIEVKNWNAAGLLTTTFGYDFTNL